MRLHDRAAIFVRHTDDGAFLDCRMRQQGRFHFRTGNVVAGGNDHVVIAGSEMEVAVFAHGEAVTGDVPAIDDVALLPVVRER